MNGGFKLNHDIELQAKRGEPICVRTLSNHCNGPFRWSSIQHGVDVTVCRLRTKPYYYIPILIFIQIHLNDYK